MPKSSTTRGIKDYLKLIGPGTIITIFGFFIAYQFVAPAPPRHITIATGSPDGAYYAFGKAYSEILQKYGITLEVIGTVALFLWEAFITNHCGFFMLQRLG